MKIVFSILKLGFFFIFLIVFYIFEHGFIFDSFDKFIGPVLLSGLTVMMLLKPNLKRRILLLSSILLILMILFYILNIPNWSKNTGDFGFSLLIVTIFLYLPQIIKKGYIERL